MNYKIIDSIRNWAQGILLVNILVFFVVHTVSCSLPSKDLEDRFYSAMTNHEKNTGTDEVPRLSYQMFNLSADDANRHFFQISYPVTISNDGADPFILWQPARFYRYELESLSHSKRPEVRSRAVTTLSNLGGSK